MTPFSGNQNGHTDCKTLLKNPQQHKHWAEMTYNLSSTQPTEVKGLCSAVGGNMPGQYGVVITSLYNITSLHMNEHNNQPDIH